MQILLTSFLYFTAVSSQCSSTFLLPSVHSRRKASPIEKTLSAALSNENWGVSGTQMQEISDATKDAASYASITTALWKTLKFPPKNWRQIFKVRAPSRSPSVGPYRH